VYKASTVKGYFVWYYFNCSVEERCKVLTLIFFLYKTDTWDSEMSGAKATNSLLLLPGVDPEFGKGGGCTLLKRLKAKKKEKQNE